MVNSSLKSWSSKILKEPEGNLDEGSISEGWKTTDHQMLQQGREREGQSVFMTGSRTDGQMLYVY